MTTTATGHRDSRQVVSLFVRTKKTVKSLQSPCCSYAAKVRLVAFSRKIVVVVAIIVCFCVYHCKHRKSHLLFSFTFSLLPFLFLVVASSWFFLVECCFIWCLVRTYLPRYMSMILSWSTYSKMWGASINMPMVPTVVTMKNTYNWRRSTTIATNFQSSRI